MRASVTSISVGVLSLLCLPAYGAILSDGSGTGTRAQVPLDLGLSALHEHLSFVPDGTPF